MFKQKIIYRIIPFYFRLDIYKQIYKFVFIKSIHVTIYKSIPTTKSYLINKKKEMIDNFIF